LKRLAEELADDDILRRAHMFSPAAAARQIVASHGQLNRRMSHRESARGG
jgi:hypothetical protein